MQTDVDPLGHLTSMRTPQIDICALKCWPFWLEEVRHVGGAAGALRDVSEAARSAIVLFENAVGDVAHEGATILAPRNEFQFVPLDEAWLVTGRRLIISMHAVN